MGNFVILALVGVIIVFAVKSVIKRGKNGCCGGGECSVDSVKVADKVEGHYPFKAMISVDDMHCGNCKKKVENALNAIPGVWATVDLSSHTAEVRMKEEHSEEELREHINKAGYGVSKVEFSK
jgi:heavy metal transport/detoxification protein